MTSRSSMAFEEALSVTVSACHITYTLKEKQREMLEYICSTGLPHAFGIFPTGYGKSDVFGLAPQIISHMHQKKAKALVVTPLRSLMRDQVARWRERGIKCHAALRLKELSEKEKSDIKEGDWSLLFLGPETLSVAFWRDIIKCHRNTICIFAIDEAHCMIDWGSSFRPEYQQIGRVRALAPHAVVVALTATLTKKMQEKVVEKLGMRTGDFETFALVPNRPNIEIEVDPEQKSDFEDKVGWYLQRLRAEGTKTPKAIIFVRDQTSMLSLFDIVTDYLEDRYWTGDGGNPGEGLVEMFYGQLDPESETALPRAFKQEESPCRCLIATVAFGLGMQVPDIEFVFHWGPPENILQYWQEVGRAGRDGRDAKAFLFIPKWGLDKRRVDEEMRSLVATSRETCTRKTILKALRQKGCRMRTLTHVAGKPSVAASAQDRHKIPMCHKKN